LIPVLYILLFLLELELRKDHLQW